MTDANGLSPSFISCMLSAGSDLVHRYYLAGNTEQAAKILEEMNQFVKSCPTEPKTWGAEELYWANMEMHAAPEITAVKAFGRDFGSVLI